MLSNNYVVFLGEYNVLALPTIIPLFGSSKHDKILIHLPFETEAYSQENVLPTPIGKL